MNALHAVADWIKTFVARPHKDLGRAGTVCPFMPGALERKAPIVMVFTDLAADRAKDFLDEVLERLGVPAYVEEGLVLGEFDESNEGTAIYNPSFRPFTSPVPFLLMRLAVISDWKFFLDDEDWFNRWAGRYGESGAQALAQQLRQLPWRASTAPAPGSRPRGRR